MPPRIDFRQDLTDHHPLNSHEAKASVRVRLLRPEDLLSVEVLGFGLDLTMAEGVAVLRPGDKPGRLEFRFVYQHVGEQAFVVGSATAPPVSARAARPSRLVFRVPVGEQIEFSTAGLLSAMTRLTLIVVPVATPARPALDLGTPFHTLPGGAAVFRVDGALLVSGKTASTGVSLLAAADKVRTARRLLTAEAVLPVKASRLSAGLVDSGLLINPGKIGAIPKSPPREPRADETSIEAPYRLILSPSNLEGFTHPMTPVGHPNAPDQVELWHTRLGVRTTGPNGSADIDDRPNRQKIVRAVWARDFEIYGVPPAANDPFLTSINPQQRAHLVRQSSDPTLAQPGQAPIVPRPVTARRLYLSALGAWLDLQGSWDTDSYIGLEPAPPVQSWDHRAVMGRDAYVKIVEPGYLFPLGHKAVKITITERKFLDEPGIAPQARLYQRQFLVITEPVRSYADSGPGKRFPFSTVRLEPLVTPDLDPMDPAAKQFWPRVGGKDFAFTMRCIDRGSSEVTLSAPLLFVVAGNNDAAAVRTAYGEPVTPGQGQPVAYTTADVTGDTTLETHGLVFEGDPGLTTSEPFLRRATVVVPAMRMLSPQSDSVTMTYAQAWLNHDFSPTGNPGQVFAEFPGGETAQVSFASSTADSGGFIQPDLPGRGLSRSKGLVGDPASVAAGHFDPAALLSGALPKLFGLFSLVDVLEALTGDALDKVPEFICDALGPVGQVISDLLQLVTTVDQTVTRLTAEATQLPEALRAQAASAAATLAGLQPQLAAAVTAVTDAVTSLTSLELTAPEDLLDAVRTPLATLNALLDDLDEFVTTAPIPTAARAALQRPLAGARSLLQGFTDDVNNPVVEALLAFVNGMEAATGARRARYTWQPEMKNWPSTGSPIFEVPRDGFTLDVGVQAGAADAGAGADVLAELRNFKLNLPPGDTLMTMDFARLAFRGGTGRKADVDVVFNGQTFDGILGFVDTLRQLIPMDGFSDPPFLDISAAGVRAGFDLGLPNISVGVFSLENMSLGADCHVPFLGEAVSVGFNFCTREKPFRLTVMMIAGGGFVGIRLTPAGLAVLEMSLEAGANLALDFGVASGSISAMVGIYIRLEDEKGSLTGYFRLRGEVDVLGLISASITLELSLAYQFDTGKMIGRASIEVEVEVLFFSASVSISCERQFAGSKGDPTLGQMLGIQTGDVDNAYWSQYCAAFGEV